MRTILLVLVSTMLVLSACQPEQPAVPPSTGEPEQGSDPGEDEVENGENGLQPEPTLPDSESGESAGGQNGNADVLYVRAVQEGETWTIEVTVEHPDTGWEDYADGWDVVLPDGTVVKPSPEDPFTRLLLHPHVEEQPFTRSQRGILIPEGTTSVRVRAHDLVDGYGGQEILVDLTVDSGSHFEVVR